jgi:hypothetical protein
MAAYGVDVLDPAMTPRRVEVLLRRVPPAARSGGEQWSTEAELLALVVDHLAALTWVTIKAHSKKGANVPKPRPIPRPRGRGPAAPPRAQGPPGPAQPGTTKTSSWAEAAAMLAAMPGMTADG